MNENENEFKPSRNQLAYAEVFLELGKKKTSAEISKECGVSRQTIFRWYKNEKFVSWINELATKSLAKSFSKRLIVAINRAEAGEFSFSKILWEIEKFYISTQRIGGVGEPIKIEVKDITKRDKDLSKELIDQFNLMRSRIPLKVRKAYLEKELQKVNDAIGNGEIEVKIKEPHELREALTMEEGN